MARLIDANALGASVSGIGKDIKRPRAVELACLVMINEAPTVDAVEVVHGRWRNEFVKGIRGVFGEVFVCSECETRYLIPNMNYCPNCGADMRDGDLNEPATSG